jgi:RNA polymerase sigma factor (sigma-70 family)
MQDDKPLDATVELLARARTGDRTALDELVERAIPPLRQWAHGRLPQWARSLAETQDLVQDAVIRTLPRLATFEPQHPGALQAFLRQAVSNHIVDEIRRANRRPTSSALPEGEPDHTPSPLEEAIGRQELARYHAALAQLSAPDREAIVARVERHQSYEEVARALGKPTANAARMTVVRAIERLVKVMAIRTSA